MAKVNRHTDLRNTVFELHWYGDDFVKLVEASTDEALFAAGEILLEKAKAKAPRRSGHLANSGYVKTRRRSTYLKTSTVDRKEMPVDRDKTVMVAFAPFYGNYFEDSGVKPHPIPKVRKRRMAKGLETAQAVNIPGVGWRRRVQHPGFRRKPFLAPALEETKDSMAVELATVLRERGEEKMGA